MVLVWPWTKIKTFFKISHKTNPVTQTLVWLILKWCALMKTKLKLKHKALSVLTVTMVMFLHSWNALQDLFSLLFK